MLLILFVRTFELYLSNAPYVEDKGKLLIATMHPSIEVLPTLKCFDQICLNTFLDDLDQVEIIDKPDTINGEKLKRNANAVMSLFCFIVGTTWSMFEKTDVKTPSSASSLSPTSR